MEQRQLPITSFIKPLLQSLYLTSEEYHEQEHVHYTTVMPLIDVVETIHHSYYFRQLIVLTYEQHTSDGKLQRHTKTGRVQSTIQDNQHFLFESDEITHLLSLEQIVAAMTVSLEKN